MIFGKQIKKGSFVLYKRRCSTDAIMTPARMQSDYANGAFALCDVTGVQKATEGRKDKIVCGPVKWIDSSDVKIFIVSEDDLLSAPTLDGVKK